MRRRILREARTIAVVGASANPARASNFVLTYLASSSADYEIWPITPRGGEILGMQTYPSLADLPAAPDIVERNMAEGRRGLRDGAGFLNYEGLDVEAYRRERLKAFVELLGHFGLNRPPVL